MITSVRFCLSYDLLNAFYRLKCVFISMKICVVVTDVVMTLFFPTESVILRVVITLYITCLAGKYHDLSNK